ncbi:MAG: RHS repeat-associated core domain-containing protein, partial [Methyloligellaceae bacterium]
HEQIDSVGLIHMNGRVYDAELGRFLSADPNVQALDNLQNFNRYSYVLNNPLSYTDPTGFFFAKLFKAIGKAFGKIFSAIRRAFKKLLRSPIVRAIIQIVACANPVTGIQCALVAGAMAKAAGGSMGDVLKAMAFSFISHKVWGAVKGVLTNASNFAKVIVHGVVNGAMTAAQGGNFLVGFATGAIGKATSFISDAISQGDMLLDTIIVAASGCGTAVLAGGSCANGAISAAFANMYNKWAWNPKAAQQSGRIPLSQTREKIASIAESYENSKEWYTDVEKDNYGVGQYKCNKFVYDVIREAGAIGYGGSIRDLTKFFSGYGGPTAGQWADPKFHIEGWEVTNNPQRGDVAAIENISSTSTGHVAIVTGPNKTTGTSYAPAPIKTSDWGFRVNQTPTFRRYIGN